MPVVVEIDPDDVAARHHDVVDPDLLEIENAEQHVAVRVDDQAAGLADGHPQFVGRQRVTPVPPGRQHEQSQDQLRDPVDQDDQRHQQPDQNPVDIGRRQRDFLRVGRGQRLRRDLGEQQQYQRQYAGGDRNPRFTVEAETDIGRELGDQHVDEIVAEQYQRNQPIRALQQFHRAHRAAVLLVGEVLQAVAIQAHQPGFRARKKGRQQDQRDKGDEKPV